MNRVQYSSNNSVNSYNQPAANIHTNKMSSNLNYLDGLLKQLLKSKHSAYSEECISFYLDEEKYIIQDLQHIHNKWSEKLKCTLIRHRGGKSSLELNSKCIVYLHGLGSSRLEALSIVQHLPQSYCMCMFDMSGSGKSDGEYITYGVKESEDIDPIISYLHRKKYIREFILWGRSMGAVATLLYSISHHHSNDHRSRGILTANNTVHNSLRNSKVSIIQTDDQILVKAIILDSPFHNFRDIAKEIAVTKLSIPNFIVEIALNYVQSSFTRILSDRIGEKYNPFHIDFNKSINLNIPIIFMYSEKDEIVPPYHSERIIKNIKTKFQKILINQCNHNQSRPAKIINEIFQKLQKFNRTKHYQNKKLSQSLSKDETINCSYQKRRGIFVYTPSREKDYKTIDYESSENPSFQKRHETIDISGTKYQKFIKSPQKQSYMRRSRIGIQNSKVTPVHPNCFKEDKLMSNVATIDSETNDFICNKLLGLKDTDSNSRKLRSKRFNMERRKEVRLTHHRYLQ